MTRVERDDVPECTSCEGGSALPVFTSEDSVLEQNAQEQAYRQLMHKFWFAADVSVPVGRIYAME